MENLNFEFIALAIGGFLIAWLYPLLKKSKRKDFSFSIKQMFSIKTVINLIFSLVAGVVILLMADSLTQTLGITMDPEGWGMDIVAFGAGHSPHFILRNVIKFFKPKEKKEAKDNGVFPS